MAYRALYRRFRPRTFEDVIGQEHITTILKNQVASGHTAHAYLFSGTRGTGKTTTARILSRAVNCLHPAGGEPCNDCDGCRISMDENNTDIIEIDAASNTGVDDVRALIEQAQYAPLNLKVRVFIIDEVHMLSPSAFNALLKTLEEPPAHILFILATTEPHKLPATIISRCQRFDFHRLSVTDIVATLKSVLTQANAHIDDEGLLVIARAADGGMRDALSLADQCLSFCGDNVQARDVYDVLGTMEQGFLFDIAEHLLRSDATNALRMLDSIVRGGRDLSVFARDLSSHFRALLLAKTCGSCADLLDCTEDAMRRYLAQAETASEARLLLALETVLRAQGDMRYLSSPRTLLESTLVRICRPEEALSLASLEARVDRLEREGSAPAASPASSPAWTPLSGSVPAPAQKKASEAPAARTPVPETPISEAPVSEAPAKKTPAAPPDAAALWRQTLAVLQKQNILVHSLAKYGVAQSLAGNTLSVGFQPAHTAQFKNLSAPINRDKLQAILEGIAPGTRLSFVSVAATPVSPEDVARAKALFGDKLRIE